MEDVHCGLWQTCPLLESPIVSILDSLLLGGGSTLSRWAGSAKITARIVQGKDV